MLYKVKNKTEHPQQINFFDGTCITVNPLCEEEIDALKMYNEELERVEKFFDIDQVSVDTIAKRVVTQNIPVADDMPKPTFYKEVAPETYEDDIDTEEVS